jgi:hypothetical protein
MVRSPKNPAKSSLTIIKTDPPKKHTYQQFSKIFIMMDKDNIFHPPNPPQGGKSLPFEILKWEWEEVSMMAFKQRFNSLLLQRRQQAT